MRVIACAAAIVTAAVPTLAAAQYGSTYVNPYAQQRQQQQQPRSGSSYDWQSGNSYHYRTDSYGNTTVNGYNLQNGTMWNSRIQPNGSQTGTDANGNYWTYDHRTKTYNNLGTGKMCVGEGYGRICN